jgi:hypothetical protein
LLTRAKSLWKTGESCRQRENTSFTETALIQFSVSTHIAFFFHMISHAEYAIQESKGK